MMLAGDMIPQIILLYFTTDQDTLHPGENNQATSSFQYAISNIIFTD